MSICDVNQRGRRPPKEMTGRTVFICLVAFFVVVAGVNAIMIGAAVSTFGGVETESAYQAGLAFARESASVKAQDALHWQVKATISSAGDGATLVEVNAADADNRPLPRLQASARLVHPADRHADRVVSLEETETGRFSGRTTPVVGQWDLVIELSHDRISLFRSRNRVFLR